jgi:hypothetical protein
MKEQDRTEFVRIMNGTAVVYGSSLTPEALGIWWNAFHEWTLDQFREGMSAAVTRTAFMPRPADVFDIRRAARPTAGEAWEIAGQGRDELADRALSIATQGRYFGHIDFEEHPWSSPGKLPDSWPGHPGPTVTLPRGSPSATPTAKTSTSTGGSRRSTARPGSATTQKSLPRGGRTSTTCAGCWRNERP